MKFFNHCHNQKQLKEFRPNQIYTSKTDRQRRRRSRAERNDNEEAILSGEYSGSSDFSGSMSPASDDDNADACPRGISGSSNLSNANRQDRSRSPRIVHREFSIESFGSVSEIESELDAELELIVQDCVREEAVQQVERASMRRNDFNV